MLKKGKQGIFKPEKLFLVFLVLLLVFASFSIIKSNKLYHQAYQYIPESSLSEGESAVNGLASVGTPSIKKDTSAQYVEPVLEPVNINEDEPVVYPESENLDGFLTIVDSRPEGSSLQSYIIEFDTSSVGERNIELKNKGIKPSDRVNELKLQKNKILDEHKDIKDKISKEIGKELVTGIPEKDQRKIFNEFDTSLNGLSVELSSEELEKVGKIKGIKRITEDTIVEATLDASIPQILADQAWPLIDAEGKPVTGWGVKIGILDTGVDYNHADLGGCFGQGCKVEGGHDFINNDENPIDDHGHGTHVASTAAGNGLLKGVAPDATIYAYKVLSSSGSGGSSGIIAAVDRCIDPNLDGDLSDHLDVCSLSLGGGGNPDDSMSLALDRAMNNNVVISVSAGNSGPNYGTIGSPGTSREAITVGAACKKTASCTIASFSSRGPVKWTDKNGVAQEMIKPDIVAPGVSICAAEWNGYQSGSRCKDDKHIAISGTSMSAPHVAGTAALIRQAIPAATAKDIKIALKSAAVPYSGFDENTQGQGLINVYETLKFFDPNLEFQTDLYSTPFVWQLTTDIKSQEHNAQQTFTIKNNADSSTTTTLSVLEAPPGLTLTLDKSTLNIPSKGTDTFTASLKADHNILASGKIYKAKILVQGSKQLYINVEVKVPNRVSTTPSLDFGVDLPSNTGTWTSSPAAGQVTNLQPSAQSVNLGVECCNGPNGAISNGITITLSSNTLSLEPSAASSFTATAAVDNNVVPNGVYTGNIIVSSPLQEPIKVPFTITKMFRLIAQYPSTEKPVKVAMHNQQDIQSVINVGTSPEVVFLFDKKYTPIDVIGYFSKISGTTPTYKFVVKEGFEFDGDDTIFLDPATATVNIKAVYTGVNGENILKPTFEAPLLKYKRNGFPQAVQAFGNYDPVNVKINPVSNNYIYSLATFYKYKPSTTANEIRKGIAFEHVLKDGISSDVTFTNTIDQLKYTPVIGNSPAADPTILLRWYHCASSKIGVTCYYPSSLTDYEMFAANNYLYNLYTLPVDTSGIEQLIYYRYFAELTSSGNVLSYSPAMHFDTNGIKRWVQKVMPLDTPTPLFIPSQDTARLDLGILPFHFAAKPTISQYQKNFNPLSTGENLAKSQEWDDNVGYDLTYSVYRDGVKINEGPLPKRSYLNLAAVINTPGNYEVEFLGRATVNNKPVVQTLKEVFTIPSSWTSSTDKQPPYISDFDFLSNNIPSQVVDNNYAHVIKFQVFPSPYSTNPDSISNAALRMKTDISDWQILQLNPESDSRYSASVPLVENAAMYTFEITAEDSYTNKIINTFEVPVGTLVIPGTPLPPVQDTIPPTTSITKPLSGETVSGTTNIDADAQDNIAVAKVEFYIDSLLQSTDTILPYSHVWDTTTFADGQHDLQTKAYDAANNMGLSSIVSVSVLNNKDTIPTTTITSPIDGSSVKIKSKVTITADAADDNSITRVAFYVDSSLKCTDDTSPYECVWTVSGAPKKNYKLQTRVYDNTGNIGYSPVVSVISYK